MALKTKPKIIMKTRKEYENGRRGFSIEEKKKILQKTNGKCACCGRGLDLETMTIDHVFPVDKGGLNDEYNMLPLCEGCNAKKSNFVYDFRHFYKHVIPEEYQNFLYYNNYATFEYTKKSIAGYDEVVFKFLPYRGYQIIDEMKRRKAKKKKIADTYEKLLMPLVLRKAYPASADAIFKLIERDKQAGAQQNELYNSSYDVLHDIKTGCVYTLENSNNICGAFIFKDISEVKDVLNIIQLSNVMEEIGLEAKYIMTYAGISYHVMPVLNEIMNFFENSQLFNGWMPIYYGILSKMYLYHDECILMPYPINGSNSNVEFMPVRHIYNNRKESVISTFKNEGYENVNDADIEFYAVASIKYMYLKDVEKAEGAEDFFNRYPNMKYYFKADSFNLYGVGI